MVKKTELPDRSGAIRKTDVPPALLTFSFRYFTHDDAVSPETEHPDGYLPALMDKLRNLSGWTVTEFLNPRARAAHVHPIDWSDTARPDGFAHLPQQVRDGTSWQFAVTANRYGRVHGLLIGGVFHVVWLDCNHKVYPRD